LKAAGSRRQWLARGLPSFDEFNLCQSLGAQLFQGPFITRREDWSSNALGPNSARIADLLSRIRRDADIREIAGVLKQDPALSLRLMKYINSAAIGLREEITSIERALMQLGREKLYRWLCLLLYGADAGNPASSALLESALVRARMLELLGQARPVSERDALFLVGLLSLVDAVLKVPMNVALAQMATSPEIEAAVARGEGPMADMLKLAIACEIQDPNGVKFAARRCGILPEVANSAQLEALGWALEVTRE
jgi:c-di-GMP phosphodiesterase